MSILQVTGLESGYFGTHIVRGVSLHVEPGEIVALIGPNGAGKSTLLNTLSGLLKPREGQVLLQGQNIAGMDPDEEMLRYLLVANPRNRLAFDWQVPEGGMLELRKM